MSNLPAGKSPAQWSKDWEQFINWNFPAIIGPENRKQVASALAKAQIGLVNPKKSLVGAIYADGANREGRAFNYASLASGLEIVRKILGQEEIVTVQTPRSSNITYAHPHINDLELLYLETTIDL